MDNITNGAEANAALKRLNDLVKEISRINGQRVSEIAPLEEKIRAINSSYSALAAPIIEEHKKLTQAINAFAKGAA